MPPSRSTTSSSSSSSFPFLSLWRIGIRDTGGEKREPGEEQAKRSGEEEQCLPWSLAASPFSTPEKVYRASIRPTGLLPAHIAAPARQKTCSPFLSPLLLSPSLSLNLGLWEH